MKTYKLILLSGIVVFSMFLSACKKNEQSVQPANQTTNNNNNGGTNTDALNVSPSDLSFVYSSGNKSVVVESNLDWSVKSNNYWISVYPASGSNNGSFSVSVTKNTSAGNRGGTVTVTGGSLTKSISISQDGDPTAGLKGAITFWFQHGFYGDPVSFYFEGTYKGKVYVSTTYTTDPGCYAGGTSTIDNLAYGSYSYEFILYNHDGSVNTRYGGSATLNSSCETVLVH